MDSSNDVADLGHMVEDVVLNDDSSPDGHSEPRNSWSTDMLRIKQQMSNQCFEMAVQLNAGKSKRPCSVLEAERDLPEYLTELERVQTIQFNSTLALHRIQMWHAIGEKLKQNNPEADALRADSERCMALCSEIKQLQQEMRVLDDEITEIQKKRLGIKRLTHEKIKAMEELMSKNEHPDTEKYKAVLEKGQVNLEKYKKMAIMTQNVLRGILLACKVNWMDDPKLRDIAMTLEEFPISH